MNLYQKWEMGADYDDALTEADKRLLEDKYNVSWSELTPEQKHSLVDTKLRDIEKREARAFIKREKEKDRMLQRELMGMMILSQAELKKRELEIIVKLEDEKLQRIERIVDLGLDKLSAMYRDLSKYIVGGVSESLSKLPENIADVGVKFMKRLRDEKLLPASMRSKTDIISIGHPSHCIMADGPDSVVYPVHKTDKVYKRCVIAEAAQSRSVLGIRMINADLLAQGGCPLPYSYNLSHQIFSGLIPSKTFDRCKYACGREFGSET